MNHIALIDYGAGNLTSVRKALTHLGGVYDTPASPAELERVRGVIVPGVGNFDVTTGLDASWRAAIRDVVDRGAVLLGICVGLQWLFGGSDEAPGLAGFGAMKGHCHLIEPPAGGENAAEADGGQMKVPHVGWNSLHRRRDSWVLDGITEGDQVYFTHSYAAPVTEDCVASTTYGVEFASLVERDRLVGMQFHPEKSGDVGLRLFRNVLDRMTASGNR